MLAYAEIIYYVPSEKECNNVLKEIRAVKVLALDLETTRGRPRVSRFPSQVGILKKNYKCSLCDGLRHNVKRCPNR